MLENVREHKNGQVSLTGGGARGFCLGSRLASQASAAPLGDITQEGRRGALPMIDVEYP